MNKEEALDIIGGQIQPFGEDECSKEMEEAWNYIVENLK